MAREKVQRLRLGPAVAMACALAVGVGLAAYLALLKLRLDFDPDYVSSCNFGDSLNCDAVQTSSHSMVMGYPLAVYGLATYLTMAIIVGLAARSWRYSRCWHAALGLGGVVICLHTLYLAYISSFVLGAYCLFCLGMYAVNFTVTGIAVGSYRRQYSKWLDLAALSESPTGAMAALATYVTIVAVSLPAYSTVRETMKAERLAQLEAELTSRNLQPTTPTPKATVGVPAPPTSPRAVTTSPEASRVGVRTRKGMSFFETPIQPGDWPLGPDDAPVTFVEYADFECGYCRLLHSRLGSLQKKYGDRIRWVFKHFPMNSECNPRMKGTMHPGACAAAKAANCAGEQGRFWPMHDTLFSSPAKFDVPTLRDRARTVGIDVEKWSECMGRAGVDAKLARDVRDGALAKLNGTPRSYINGRLVPGVQATEVLEYYLDAALREADANATNETVADRPMAPVPPSGAMVPIRAGDRQFWIDAYEASIDADGRAVAQSGVVPAQVSWLEARAACEAAGKRLCTEEEWISACAGAPAIDNDGDGLYADDAIEGWLFPYGPFHRAGVCHDNEPKYGGSPRPTGVGAECRTPSGVFDLAGNLAEWTGREPSDAAVSGSYFSLAQKADCRGRDTAFGPGYRNQTTGFRCCADREIRNGDGEAEPRAAFAAEGSPAPAFEVKTSKGETVTEKSFLGHVTVVAFFASWCGPCKRELPELDKLYAEHVGRGLRVLAVGVDTEASAARSFVEPLKLGYDIAFDPDAISMGRFGVKGMPTSFIVDRKGEVRHRLVGIKKEELDEFRARVARILDEK